MSEPVDTTPRFKVGDELAFMSRSPYGGRWYFNTIERITPSGILVCGKTRVRVSGGGQFLSVIGESGWSTTRVEPATDEIRRAVRRDRMIDKIEKTKWRDLNEDIIAQVWHIVRDRKPVEEKL
jgi:hypothetical protein